jgi:hypothetical protein
MYLDAAPTIVVMLALVPDKAGDELSVAVIVVEVPETVCEVNVTVARPFAFVLLVAAENDPFASDFVQVTSLPGDSVLTGLSFASASWAVMVMALPATRLPLDETIYFVAAPATVDIVALVPVILPVLTVLPVTASVPTIVPVVNVTVACPFAPVVLVTEENDPPAPFLLHVTTFPCVVTGLLCISASCAVIVTAVPATGALSVDVTRYLAAVPTVVVILAVVPVIDDVTLSVAVTVAKVPITVCVVNVIVAIPFASVLLDAADNDPFASDFVHVAVWAAELTA